MGHTTLIKKFQDFIFKIKNTNLFIIIGIVPFKVFSIVCNALMLALDPILETFLHSHHGWEGIGFMWKMAFENFIKSLRIETSWVRKKGFLRKCLSACHYQIELSFGTLYRNRKSQDKFVNQPHPIKIEGLSTTFVFLKIIFWKNQKF